MLGEQEETIFSKLNPAFDLKKQTTTKTMSGMWKALSYFKPQVRLP